MTPAIERAAALAVEAAATRLAEAMRSVSGVRIDVDGGEVIVTGRGLRRRRLTDADLRWPGGER